MALSPYRAIEAIHYCGEKLESTDTVYLCRCGDSQNPPFCGGNHSKTVSSKQQAEIDNTPKTTTGGSSPEFNRQLRSGFQRSLDIADTITVANGMGSKARSL
jgi:CDGSH-type Zn-finger protein